MQSYNCDLIIVFILL